MLAESLSSHRRHKQSFSPSPAPFPYAGSVVSIDTALGGTWTLDSVSPDLDTVLQPPGSNFTFQLGPGPAYSRFTLASGTTVSTQWTIKSYDCAVVGEVTKVTIKGTVDDDTSDAFTIKVTIRSTDAHLRCRTHAGKVKQSGSDSGTWTAHDM